jgi:tetratricopeptide (TPR) repeat protein
MALDARRPDPLWPWDAALIAAWLIWGHFHPQEAYPHGRVLAAGLILAALLARGLLARRRGVSGRQATAVTLLFFALPIWGWIATRGAANPPEGALILGTWLQGSALAVWGSLVVLSRAKVSEPEIDRLLRGGLVAFGLLALALAVWGFWNHFVLRPQQIMENSPLWSLGDERTLALLHNLAEGRMRSSLGDPNHLGLLTALGVVALGCGATWARSNPWRISLIVGGLVTLAALALTGSRAGHLSLIGGGAVLLWPLLRGVGAARRRTALILLWTAAVFLCAALILALVSPPAWVQRIANVTTVRERMGYWAIAWQIFLDAPFTGRGVGAYVTWYPSLRPEGLGTARFAHSLPLQLIAEIGLIGLLAASLPLWPLLKGRRSSSAAVAVTEGRAVAAALTVIGLNSLVGHSIYFREIWLDASLLLGLAVGWRLAHRADERPAAARQWLPAVATVTLAAAFLWPGEIRRSRADLLDEHATALLEEGRLREGLETSEQQVDEEPDFDRWRVAAANRLLAVAPTAGPGRRTLLSRAEAHLRTALRLCPLRPSTHATLALLHRERGDLDRAVKAQREAVRLHPAEPRHRSQLAALLMEMDDLEAAEAEARRALDLHGANYDALLTLGEILLRREDFEGARDCAGRASESSALNRGRPAPWHLLSRIEFAAGDIGQARAAADEALRRHPTSEELLGWRRRLGDP